MTDLNDRRDALEKKFAHDEEMRFRTESHAVKELARWAAGQMNLDGAAQEVYLKSIVDFHVHKKGSASEKIYGDLTAHKVDITRHGVDRRYDALLEDAKRETLEGK